MKKMKRNILILFHVLLASFIIRAQNNVGINTNSPNPSAALDVSSTNQGILIPRMTTAQRTAIALPATGLMVYQTTAPAGFYFFNGTAWIRLDATNATQLQGRDIVNTAPVTGQVLAWSPTGTSSPNTWQPMSLPANFWTDNGTSLYPSPARHLEPLSSNVSDLGSTGFKWRNIYLNNEPIIGSDRRIKENIKPIAYGLNAVLKMKPVQYNLIGVPSTDVSLGLIAQDVKLIIPEIVCTAPSEPRNAQDTRPIDPTIPQNMQSIRYGDLIPVLIKAIQELEAKVSSLENQLSNKK